MPSFVRKMHFSSFSFFFSSRRRHTRCSRDWSSDVCSSDLDDRAAPSARRTDRVHGRVTPPRRIVVDLASPHAAWRVPATTVSTIQAALGPGGGGVEGAVPTASDSPGAPGGGAAGCGAADYLGTR